MQLYHDTITVCTAMADLKDSLLPLLLLVRAVDKHSSGVVEVDLNEVAKFFGCTVETARRKVLECKNLGYFHEYSKPTIKEHYRIYYRSMARILAEKGVSTAGGIAKLSILKHGFSLKFALTEIAAAFKQEQSKFAAEKAARKAGTIGRDDNLPFPWDLLKAPTSENWEGRNGEPVNTNRGLIVGSDAVSYGANQKSIAKMVNVSRRTVSRRLSDRYRIDRNLPVVAKAQQFRVLPNDHYAQLPLLEDSFIRGIDGTAFLKDSKLGALQAMPNLYNPDFNLIEWVPFRKRLKREFNALKPKTSKPQQKPSREPKIEPKQPNTDSWYEYALKFWKKADLDLILASNPQLWGTDPDGWM